jgi:hypothetical protein
VKSRKRHAPFGFSEAPGRASAILGEKGEPSP